jgi:hypothetical protein
MATRYVVRGPFDMSNPTHAAVASYVLRSARRAADIAAAL